MGKKKDKEAGSRQRGKQKTSLNFELSFLLIYFYLYLNTVLSSTPGLLSNTHILISIDC